jgi:hypothetical protein
MQHIINQGVGCPASNLISILEASWADAPSVKLDRNFDSVQISFVVPDSRAATRPRRLSSPGVTNGCDIPFEVIHRVIVECPGAPEKSLRLLPRAQPAHLLDFRRRDHTRAIHLDGDRFQTAAMFFCSHHSRCHSLEKSEAKLQQNLRVGSANGNRTCKEPVHSGPPR